jgi:hypothetical protein
LKEKSVHSRPGIEAQGRRSPNYPQKEAIYLVFMS